MNWLRRMTAIASKETRQLLRDRVTFGLIIGIPAMQIMLFGYAINFDVRDLDAVVLDQARSSLSRQLVGDLAATQVMHITWQADSGAEFDRIMERGDANIGVVILPDLDRSIGEVEGRREELEQEDAVWMRRGAAR